MQTNTLTSLAILKVNIDQGKDYLDYLQPFVLQVLVDHNPDPITRSIIKDYIREQFALEIPDRTIEIVLKRLSKQYLITKREGKYRKTGDLPNPQIISKQAEATRRISAVLDGLRKFSQETSRPLSNEEEAVTAICAFLGEFDIICLQAYLRGTAIPDLEVERRSNIVLVSDYVQQVLSTDPERFDSFLVLVQGHMLANALLCPDLQMAPHSYKNVTFYLDTPFLVQRLGCEGEYKKAAARELITLLQRLGGKVATFSHSRDELRNVLEGAALYLEKPDGRGAIVLEARRAGTTISDLLLLASSIDEQLREAKIDVLATPRYTEKYQIDETAFEQILNDEVSYYNPRAKEYDINSVRSIYVIRGNHSALSIENARAVLVTTNNAFAEAAWKYGQHSESSKAVSSVITDFTLANIAWLKAPIGASSIPKTQLFAFSYAALEPSNELLSKYLVEIDKLKDRGTITERDHQLLRSNPRVYRDLMHLTLGEDAALTDEAITTTLERVSEEIKKEESEKLMTEQEAHHKTRDALDSAQAQNQEIKNKLYWRCYTHATIIAWVVSVAITLPFFVAGLELYPAIAIASWLLVGGSVIYLMFMLANFVFGFTMYNLHEWLQNRLLRWLLKRQSKAIGVNFN